MPREDAANRWISEVKTQLEEETGTDDLVGVVLAMREDLKQALRVLIRESLAEEREFKTPLEDDE